MIKSTKSIEDPNALYSGAKARKEEVERRTATGSMQKCSPVYVY